MATVDSNLATPVKPETDQKSQVVVTETKTTNLLKADPKVAIKHLTEKEIAILQRKIDIYMANGDMDSMKKDCIRGIELKNKKCLSTLVKQYKEEKDYANMVKYLHVGIEWGLKEYMFALGNHYYSREKNMELVGKYYMMTLPLDEEVFNVSPKVFLKAGIYYIEKEEYDDAITCLLQAIKLDNFIHGVANDAIKHINEYLTIKFNAQHAYMCRKHLYPESENKLMIHMNTNRWMDKDAKHIDCIICYKKELSAYVIFCNCTFVSYCCKCVLSCKKCPTCRTEFNSENDDSDSENDGDHGEEEFEPAPSEAYALPAQAIAMPDSVQGTFQLPVIISDSGT